MKECIMLGRGPTCTECEFDKPVWSVSWVWDVTDKVDKIFTVHKWAEEETEEFKKSLLEKKEIIVEKIKKTFFEKYTRIENVCHFT